MVKIQQKKRMFNINETAGSMSAEENNKQQTKDTSAMNPGAQKVRIQQIKRSTSQTFPNGNAKHNASSAEKQDNTTKIVPDVRECRKSMAHRIYPIAAVIAFAVMVLLHFLPKTNLPANSAQWIPQIIGSQHTTGNTSKLRSQIAIITQKYKDDGQQMLNEFRNTMRTSVKSDFETARANVGPTVEQVTGFSACAKFCYKAAKDKLQGTNDFEQAFQTVIDEPIIQPCVNANIKANEALQAFAIRMQERNTQYNIDLASVCEMEGEVANIPAADLTALQSMINNFAVSMFDYQAKKLCATVGVAFEVVFLKDTIQVLTKLLTPITKRLATSAGVSVVCAAADGPIPIGDIIGATITIGSLAWTAYDIHQVCKVLSPQLREELTNGINSTESDLCNSVESCASGIVAKYASSADELSAKLIEQLQ